MYPLQSKERVAIVGAGFSGAVIAHSLCRSGYSCDVFETCRHVAGHCHSEHDSKTGILIHVFGPHIFHTDNIIVWNFVRQFDEFMPFANRVKAISKGSVYSFPINLLTINQFFGKTFSPAEAKQFIDSLREKSIIEPTTLEEQALRFVGRDLYEAFFKGYTMKQWGMDPSSLPASIMKRIPVRFNYEDKYYDSAFQGLPKHGYTYVIEKLLDHKNIKVHLGSLFRRASATDYAHVFYSGPIDTWFDHSEGRLAYRTLDFECKYYTGDYQGNPVINYCDLNVPWTRVYEHKHFSPWESHTQTVIYKEYSRNCEAEDPPYYPIRLVGDRSQLARYVERARAERNVTFVGRLGTYRYLDMDVTIAEALDVAVSFLRVTKGNDEMPAFVVDPL